MQGDSNPRWELAHTSGSSKQAWQIPDTVCTDLSSWWWAEKPPETCRALTVIKNIIQHCILLLYMKNTLTMHGHINVKIHTLNTHNMSHSIHLYQSVSLSLSAQLVSSSSSHSLLIFHYISPSVPSTALDIQHFLKPFTVTSGEMHCHAVVIHIDVSVTLIFNKKLWQYIYI